jgi:hypothetical protein
MTFEKHNNKLCKLYFCCSRMNPKRLRLDFGVCQIRVMRVNEAPPLSQSSPTLDAPEKVHDFWQEHIATAYEADP